MKHGLFVVSALLVATLVVGGLAGCQKQLPGPRSPATESADRALTVEAWDETPVPGSTVVSAVTSTPVQGTVEVPPLVITSVALPTEAHEATPVPTAASTEVQPEPTSTAAPAAKTTVHTVRVGETLSGIAAFYGVSVQAIVRENGLSNPNQIYPGQKLTIPKPASGGSGPCRYYHTVRTGDWVWQIARNYAADPYAILRANGLSISSTIYAGMVLCIP